MDCKYISIVNQILLGTGMAPTDRKGVETLYQELEAAKLEKERRLKWATDHRQKAEAR